MYHQNKPIVFNWISISNASLNVYVHSWSVFINYCDHQVKHQLIQAVDDQQCNTIPWIRSNFERSSLESLFKKKCTSALYKTIFNLDKLSSDWITVFLLEYGYTYTHIGPVHSATVNVPKDHL